MTRRANLEWKVPALGLEREGRLVERARLLSEEEGEDGQARFARFDAFSGRPRLGPADLALGLHACGALADILVAAAAEAGCPVAVVACCHQKHPGDRRDPCPFGRAA